MLKDEIGNKYNRLTVIKRAENYKDGTAQWSCQCNCGNIVIHKGSSLRRNKATSCGCFNIECHTKHLMCFSREYKSWQGMKERCYNKNSKSYKDYGARGITVCKSWVNSFESFYADMGGREKGMSIDRINNNGNYEPSNCRWANMTEQSNNRRSSHYVTFNGDTKSISEWARVIGITPQALTKILNASNDTAYIFSQKMNTHGSVINVGC